VKRDAALKRLFLSDNRVLMRYNAIKDIVLLESKDSLRKKLNIEQDDFVVLFVGRLVPQKSVHTLLEALPLLRGKVERIKCILVGEGKLRNYLEERCKQLGLTDIVEFRGVTSMPELYYVCSDVFVLPSVYEGLGNVIIEAFRASLPVVASDIDGIKELVSQGKNGLLFDVGNYQSLADKIALLYNDKEVRQKMSVEAFDTFKSKFDMAKYSEWLLLNYRL
jgi:glycosyltransferase involved in cell wall biosynthesis